MIDGQVERFPGQIPECDFEAAQRGRELVALRTRENTASPEFIPDSINVQGIAPGQRMSETADQTGSAFGSIGRLTLTDQTLVGVDADVRLRTVHHHHGGADVYDFQFSPSLGR